MNPIKKLTIQTGLVATVLGTIAVPTYIASNLTDFSLGEPKIKEKPVPGVELLYTREANLVVTPYTNIICNTPKESITKGYFKKYDEISDFEGLPDECIDALTQK